MDPHECDLLGVECFSARRGKTASTVFRMAMHEQVELRPGVSVDVGMVGLIEALWSAGFETTHSCQGEVIEDANPLRLHTTGYVAVVAGFEHMAQLVEIVGSYFTVASVEKPVLFNPRVVIVRWDPRGSRK